MSAEIKSGTERCASTIEHETAGILRCDSGHEPFLPYPDVHGCGGHGWADGDSRTITPARPWCFDVPEVPARVTAVEDGMGWTWVRDGAAWLLWGRPASYRIYDRDLIGRLPLVECPDPRAAS